MKKPSILGLALPLLLISGPAAALSAVCAADYSSASFYGGMDYMRQYSPECVSGTSGAIAQNVIRATSLSQGYAISDAVNNRFTGASSPNQFAAQTMTGLSAGASPSKWSVWGNANNNAHRYSVSGPLFAKSDSDTMNLVLGADYLVTPKFILGISAALDDTGGTTYSRANGSMNLDTSGYNLAPYLGWQISPEWSLDASFGWGKGHYRDDISTAKSTRTFAGANLSYTRWFGPNWQLLGKAGYFHAEEKYGDTSVSQFNLGTIPNSGYRNRLDQFRVGGQIGYWTQGVMPYLGLAYTNDTQRKTAQGNAPWDRDAFVLTLGIDFTSLKEGVIAGLSFNREIGRNDSNNYNFIGTLNIRF